MNFAKQILRVTAGETKSDRNRLALDNIPSNAHLLNVSLHPSKSSSCRMENSGAINIKAATRKKSKFSSKIKSPRQHKNIFTIFSICERRIFWSCKQRLRWHLWPYDQFSYLVLGQQINIHELWVSRIRRRQQCCCVGLSVEDKAPQITDCYNKFASWVRTSSQRRWHRVSSCWSLKEKTRTIMKRLYDASSEHKTEELSTSIKLAISSNKQLNMDQ